MTRDSQKQRTITATIEDFETHGITPTRDTCDMLQGMTIEQIDFISQLIVMAWSDGFQRGERQPFIADAAMEKRKEAI